MAGVLRERFPTAVVVPAVLTLLVANTINLGVDIGAIAAAVNLFVPIPTTLVVLPVAVVILLAIVAGSYELIARVFRWLTLALFAYIGAAILAGPDPVAVVTNTFIPSLAIDKQSVLTLVAILGTTISPYLFFYQAEDEVETQISVGKRTIRERKGATKDELRFAGWDVTAGMLFSNVVMYFIILATAATLHESGKTDIGSAAEAAQALQPIAGDAASLLLAVGLIGSGFLAVPVLAASASYALAETFHWKRGLDEKPDRARRFYAVIAASVLVGILVNFVGINPIDALFWTAVLNGVLAPPLLVLVMLIANDRKLMGRRTNGTWTNVLGWGTAVLMFAAVVAWGTLTLAG
jgi:Mn2+/Fe2+ NRAMP family transporter